MSFFWPSQDDRQRELCERAQKGDRDAFRALYLELYEPVSRYVSRRIVRREDAEDLVAKVFFKLLERLGEFDAGRGTVRMFVLSMTRNAVIDHLRVRQKTMPVEELAGGLADERGTPFESLSRREELKALQRALASLPAEAQEALELYYGDGLKHAESAALLGIGVDAFKQRLSRARKALKERLRDPEKSVAEEALEGAKEGAVINVRF